MSGRDITEGRATRAIGYEVGLATGTIWQNTGNDYDIAIGGIPFLLDATDQHPYERGTAPFRKQQFDNQRDPGEQSLQGWWVRSQSSFHAGQGILFYDPFANPFSTTLASNSYRYANSIGINPFTFGQVSLLRRPSQLTSTSSATQIESVQISGVDNLIMLDTNIVTVNAAGTKTTLVTAVNPIYSFTTDGTNVYYLDSGHFVKKPLAGGSATNLYAAPSSITSSALHWAKQRLVAGVNNVLYEVVGSGAGLPTAVYTHPNTAWKWTDIDEAGPAIYASGYAGANSTIYKFVLDTSGAMPVLTSGIIAAQLPLGEVVYSLYSHLGTYLCIGTNKGVRIGQVDQNNGDIIYGPLLVETNTPVRGFAARNSYVWFGTSVHDGADYYCGTFRIDLGNEIDTLRFAVAQDIYAENLEGDTTYDVAFLGNTDRLAFLASPDANTASNLGLWLESATEVYPSGWLQTGYIRYNTLEQKNFKRIVGRGDFGTSPSPTIPGGRTRGSMSISSVDDKGNRYDIVTYDDVIGTPEATITNPIGAQDSIALRFTLNRDATDITLSPVFKGYQLKAVPATPRTRIIKIPLLCYDTETDKYNATLGYEGRAFERLAALEDLEAAGDVVILQDFRTGETNQCLIEELAFINKVSPDKKLTNFGGTLIITVRTV